MLISLRGWCKDVEALLHGQPENLFTDRRVHELALSKSVEQVGEFCGRWVRKDPDFAAQRRELEMLPAYGMRNKPAQSYDDIVTGVVIATGRKDIPGLRNAVEANLREAGEDVP